jgi:2-hydroxychromene-2-carboxylate isomerase
MLTLELFYDFVCPYAYIASRSADALADRPGVELAWVPTLLGGVFRAIGTPDVPMNAVGPAKAAYMKLELERAASAAGLKLQPPAGHPRRTVLALRAVLATDDVRKASHAMFAAYWERGEDVEDREVVRAALSRAGFDGARAVEAAQTQPIKDALLANTKRAIDRGVFGVPAFVVTDEGERSLYWGVDRMSFVERALLGAKTSEPPRAEPPAAARSRPATVVTYFDYSSPFAYLASTRLDAIERATGARVELRPILLGGLFRDIGTPDVPLFEMPEPKRRYQLVDLERWASRYGVGFRFPTRFPMNTVKALRLTLLCPEERRRPLVGALFDALWALDRDISSDDELRSIATSAGVDPALVDRLGAPEVKAELRARTDEAKDRGVFGVPTFFVGDEMFWGQDRIDRVLAKLT